MEHKEFERLEFLIGELLQELQSIRIELIQAREDRRGTGSVRQGGKPI